MNEKNSGEEADKDPEILLQITESDSELVKRLTVIIKNKTQKLPITKP